MDWKIEDLKRGDEFKDVDGYKVIYQGRIGDFMAFINECGESLHFGIEELKKNLTLIPKHGWKDLTIEEACVLIKNTKKIWARDDCDTGVTIGVIFGYTQWGARKYEVSGGIHLHHASMYNDQGEPADDYSDIKFE